MSRHPAAVYGRSSSVIRHALIAVAAVILAGGCATTPDSTPSATAPATSAISPAPAISATPAPVPDILKFTATTVDEKAFDGASLAGSPAVLWFWAAWCSECRAHAGAVRDLQAQYAGKVSVVGVAGLASGKAGMQKFVADYKLAGFPQLADDTGTVWQHFKVPRQDYFVILDRTGAVVHSGPATIAQVKQKIDKW